jgi:transaldolase
MATTAVQHDSSLSNAVRDFCLRGWQPPRKDLREGMRSDPTWAALRQLGTALWLDTGDVGAAKGLWTREMTALTTNNTLLNKEVQKGIYDQLVPKAAALLRKADRTMTSQQLVLEIAFILNAVHGLGLVSTFDADVSVELHTDLARDTEASYHYGKRFAAICPERFIVKVPLTPEGIFAARRLRQDGVRINFTLGFSARQNYVIALLARPNWVNVFMGRLNAFVADNKLGDGKNVGEKATLASQRMLRMLRQGQGIETRQIGASMRNGQQCFDLMGLDVFTMPVAAAKQFLDLKPAPAQIQDRTAGDPPVDAKVEKLDVLWEVGDGLKAAMCKLAGMDLAAMNGPLLRAFLAEHGVRDLFFELSPAERTRITKETKIPVYQTWRSRVVEGTASWDGILTEAALASFADDQKALDERIGKLV